MEAVEYNVPAYFWEKFSSISGSESPARLMQDWLCAALYFHRAGLLAHGEDICGALLELREKGIRLLKSVLELHINMERVAGRIDAAAKEMAEANALPHKMGD